MGTRITETKWKNRNAISLENEELLVITLPELGGKIASVYHKGADFELAAQNQVDFYRLPGLDASFSEYDASGLDDAFPSIDACPKESGLSGFGAYPDHGEIWSSPMKSQIFSDQVVLSMESSRFPYSYRKTLALSGEKLQMDYEICNTGDEPFPCLWAFHGLVRYEEDMELFYNEKVQSFENVLDSPELGQKGRKFLLENSSYDFTHVPPKNSGTMIKYYVREKLENGICGYRYPSQGVGCTLRYDAEKLPYLGFWLTAGGYRGDYNCALEPASGYYDDIRTASENGTLYFLEKGKPLCFSMEICLQRL